MSKNEKPCACETSPKMKKASTRAADPPQTSCDCGAGAGQNGEAGCACTNGNSGDSQHRGVRNAVPAPNIYPERRPVKGEVVTVIDVTFPSDGIELTDAWSRAVPRGEVHEIMVWDPLAEGDDAGAVAFIEITQGGNIVNGDEVRLDGEAIGRLVGFDYNHMPNHMNIVVETNNLELSLSLGSTIEFIPNPMLPLLDDDKCC